MKRKPGAALAALRRTYGGGRPVTCSCGKCRKCKNRERMARVRASS